MSSVRIKQRSPATEMPVQASHTSPPERFSQKTMGVTVLGSFVLMAMLTLVVVLSGLAIIAPTSTTVNRPHTTATSLPSAAFDPSINAPLPNNRLVLFYGIAYSQIDHNGPASLHPFTFLSQLQQLGQAWTQADPKHPAKLGLDLVVNVADSCQEYVVETCEHDVPQSILDAYISFCQEHGLYLFLDFQFGRATVQSVVTHYLPYLERYPFVEMALDTEFHFYTPNYGIPSFDPGYMKASDVNWVIGQLAQIPMIYHVPRKVLLVHEWFDGAVSDIQTMKADPQVSIVLHSDGFGIPHDKIVKYDLLFLLQAYKYGGAQYGGFKLFDLYQDCPYPQQPGCSGDLPQWTPQDVLHPQLLDSDPADSQLVASMAATPPLLVSYE